MWIERKTKKTEFIQQVISLNRQVILVQGARQVGKSSFILNALQALSEHPQIKLNFNYAGSFTVEGVSYLGRDFFGKAPGGEDFLKNLELALGPFKNLDKPAVVFVDEVDRHPLALESIQSLAEFSARLKFIFTGSNLENIPVTNAATGRKRYFDLYPITFREFLLAAGQEKLLSYLNGFSLKDQSSEYYHQQISEFFMTYLRLGGMPRLLDAYLDPPAVQQTIPQVIKDLAFSIEENVKAVLGEKSHLYEYEDILRKLALFSLNTLKLTQLQVQHAGRSEAKKIVSKTSGARVAHKIRLFESEKDLSKYILFDCGLVNYLLNGSDLLKTLLGEKQKGILYETFVGTELIAGLTSREDLWYWKSGNQAELEYVLRSPYFVGIDVKADKGYSRSLASFALLETDSQCLVRIANSLPSFQAEYRASLPHSPQERRMPMLTIPHFLTCRLMELLGEVKF